MAPDVLGSTAVGDIVPLKVAADPGGKKKKKHRSNSTSAVCASEQGPAFVSASSRAKLILIKLRLMQFGFALAASLLCSLPSENMYMSCISCVA